MALSGDTGLLHICLLQVVLEVHTYSDKS